MHVSMNPQQLLDERAKKEKIALIKSTLSAIGFELLPDPKDQGIDILAKKYYKADVEVLINYYKEPTIKDAIAFERAMRSHTSGVGIIVSPKTSMDKALFTVGKPMKAIGIDDVKFLDNYVRDMLIW
jgi:hypothetical protein